MPRRRIIDPEPNPRVFTIAEVDALIPELSRRIEGQLTLQSEIEQRLGRLVDHLGELPDTIVPNENEPKAVYSLKCELADQIGKYEAGWREIQSMGAVVKDPQSGLLDFYGRIEGRLVWLCWKFGEERLGYYHELDAGFAGRRALGAELRDRLLN